MWCENIDHMRWFRVQTTFHLFHFLKYKNGVDTHEIKNINYHDLQTKTDKFLSNLINADIIYVKWLIDIEIK